MSSARPEPVHRRNRARNEAIAAPAMPWPGVLHDVRGAATAIEALAGLVADDSPALSPSSKGLLDLIQARAEQLGSLCEALAFLQGPASGRQSLDRILALATGRLQKFLERSAIRLKSPGEIPDKDFESRPLVVLLQSILVTAANARAHALRAHAGFEVIVLNGTTRILIDLSGPGWGAPARDAVQSLADEARCGELGPHGVAARHALDCLRGSLETELHDEGLRVVLELPPAPAPAPTAVAGERP